MAIDAKEADLCDRFMSTVRNWGWQCYPETCSWDILLVRDQVQIGIQAKLHFNIRVVEQCLEIGSPSYRKGPDYRAILTPKPVGKCILLNRLRLMHFSPTRRDLLYLEEPMMLSRLSEFHWKPLQPAWTPDIIPQVQAGAACPLRLTFWKQGALRLFARAAVRGYVTSADFNDLKINRNTFVQAGWLIPEGNIGRMQRLVINQVPGRLRPDQQHPAEFEYFCQEYRDSVAAIPGPLNFEE